MTEHVKVYGVKPRIQYTADGSLTTYEFPFAIFSASDLDVYFGENLQDTATYTVTGVGESDGGSVTFAVAPAADTTITIVRNLSIERTSDFQEGATLRAKVLNDELDYQVACQQQIADNLNRSMVLPPYAADNDLDLTLPLPSAGKAIIWNSDGTNLENSEVEINTISRELDAKVNSATTQAGIATSAAETAATQAQTATSQAGIATTQAGIATQKAEAAAATATEIASHKTVVETYSNGSSWYRIWSDGWCEQGSITSLTQNPQSINLIKPFLNTNYTLTACNGDPDDNSNVVSAALRSKTTTSFTIVSGYSGTFFATTLDWIACGYVS